MRTESCCGRDLAVVSVDSAEREIQNAPIEWISMAIVVSYICLDLKEKLQRIRGKVITHV